MKIFQGLESQNDFKSIDVNFIYLLFYFFHITRLFKLLFLIYA